MSWADDIRCLHCDGRLPLYRKITNGQFCSAAHRKAYWQEQERLAVERLHQTHDSLRAYKPRGPVEAILGPEAVPALEAVPAPEVVPSLQAVRGPGAYDINLHAERPAWLTQSNTGDVPMGRLVPDTGRLQPRWLADRGLVGEAGPFPAELAPRSIVAIVGIGERGTVYAGTTALPWFTAVLPVARIMAPGVAATNFTIVPIRRLDWISVPLTEGFPLLRAIEEGSIENAIDEFEAPAPLLEALFALGRIAAAFGSLRGNCEQLGPIAILSRTHVPLFAELEGGALTVASLLQIGAGAAGLRQAGVVQLRLDQCARIPAPWIDMLRALDLRAGMDAPQLRLETPPLRPRLRLAAGRRYAVETPGSDANRAPAPRCSSPELELANLSSIVDVSLPHRTPQVLRAAAGVGAQAGVRAQAGVGSEPSAPAEEPQAPRNFEPDAAGLLPLECNTRPSESPAAPQKPSLALPQPPRTEPMRPMSHLEPMAASSIPAAPAFIADAENTRANVWTHTVDFWNRAPRDLKMLVFAIPLLLGLAMHPALPKVRVAAPAAATGLERNVERAMNAQWSTVKQSVLDRAAIALDEDFRSGLDDWASRGDVATDWSFDATGFVQPGPLALYRPSMSLTDYQLQFLGMIDKKALSWVVRAADFDNYYVVKLVVLKSGPLPSIGLTRYAVVNGQADARADVVVPIDARVDMLYRVRLDVHGDDFSLTVQGQMVDAWSEPRLRRGGVGFFSSRGEQSRVRWVQLTHQYDTLGRLCAYLAPYNISSTTGGWQ